MVKMRAANVNHAWNFSLPIEVYSWRRELRTFVSLKSAIVFVQWGERDTLTILIICFAYTDPTLTSGGRIAAMIEGARIQLNTWQRAAVAFGSAVGALLDPRRADLIAALGETTGKPAFERVLQRMKSSPEGRAVLLERPRVISAKVQHAWDMPANTFGAAYARFMGSRNFSPDDRPPVRFMDTDELAYVAMRAREVHDFWHTLFDLPTNLIGESALKVIEFQQMHLPMCFMSVIGGTVRFSEKQRKLFYQHYFPWAIRAGMQCTDLMCIYYEQHFRDDLEDVRRKLGIIPAPAASKPHVS